MGFHTQSVSTSKAMQGTRTVSISTARPPTVTAEQRDHAAQRLREHFKAGASAGRRRRSRRGAGCAAEAERTRKLEALASGFRPQVKRNSGFRKR